MRPGKMDRKLVVQRQVETGRTPLNEPIKTWQTVHTVWAEKIHKSEDEAFASSQRYASRVVTFRVYFLADLNETDRLMVDGETYNIAGIRELGYRAGTEISAEWKS
jgi:SPP1 family predicted phage head-tail adaptor